jgi:hypothetical protein
MKTETKIKLSPKQKEVIRLMREGWEIKESIRAKTPCHIVNGKGAAITVAFNTYPKLLELNLIDMQYINPYFLFGELTELGKPIDIN